MRIAIALVSMVSVVHADELASEQVGDYTIDAGGFVTKGAIKSPLVDGKELAIQNFVGDAKARRVSFSTSAFCAGMPAPDFKFTFDQLEARIVNVSALKLHLAKKSKEAIAGFARAAKLDPVWNIAAYNLASARNVGGDRAGALAALGPMLAAQPVQTYYQVLIDPELQSLATAKELTSLKTTARGTGKHDSKDYLYSGERSLIAYDIARGQSYLTCFVPHDLVVHDTRTGKRVATIPLMTDADTAGIACTNPVQGPSKAGQKKLDERLAKRRAVVDAFLGDLGFSVAPFESAVMPHPNDVGDGKLKATFPKSKMYAVVGKSGTNILRGNTVVGTVTGSTQIDYIEAAKYAVGLTTNQNEGGCPNETYDSGPVK